MRLLHGHGQSLLEKISGPLLDRIDIHIEVPCATFEKLSSQYTDEPSATVRERVEAAWAIQRERFNGTTLQTNADMSSPKSANFAR